MKYLLYGILVGQALGTYYFFFVEKNYFLTLLLVIFFLALLRLLSFNNVSDKNLDENAEVCNEIYNRFTAEQLYWLKKSMETGDETLMEYVRKSERDEEEFRKNNVEHNYVAGRGLLKWKK